MRLSISLDSIMDGLYDRFTMKAGIEFNPRQIQALREGLGLSQAEFGERLDVTRQAVSLWETGTSHPSVATILKIVNLWGAKLDSFFRDASA